MTNVYCCMICGGEVNPFNSGVSDRGIAHRNPVDCVRKLREQLDIQHNQLKGLSILLWALARREPDHKLTITAEEQLYSMGPGHKLRSEKLPVSQSTVIYAIAKEDEDNDPRAGGREGEGIIGSCN